MTKIMENLNFCRICFQNLGMDYSQTCQCFHFFVLNCSDLKTRHFSVQKWEDPWASWCFCSFAGSYSGCYLSSEAAARCLGHWADQTSERIQVHAGEVSLIRSRIDHLSCLETADLASCSSHSVACRSIHDDAPS